MWAIMASPLLISANVRNMSAMNLETYSNKAVIRVNQDTHGRQGIRVFGEPLLAGGATGLQPTTTTPCDRSGTTSLSQTWEVGTGARDEFLVNVKTGRGLNADDCSTDLVTLPLGASVVCVCVCV